MADPPPPLERYVIVERPLINQKKKIQKKKLLILKKNLVFCTPGGGLFVRLWRAPLLSVVGAIGRADLRKEVGLLRPGPRCPKVHRHQMVQ